MACNLTILFSFSVFLNEKKSRTFLVRGGLDIDSNNFKIRPNVKTTRIASQRGPLRSWKEGSLIVEELC
jgi:hypothetical protein